MTTAPFFHLIGSKARERIVKLTGTTTIGRATDNMITLDDQTISQYHALVLIQPEGIFLMDLESTNGTTVNAVPALPNELVHLTDGDLITIGEIALHYQAPSLQT
jgi:ABC transport system ATP-binding/permease protein